MVTVTAIVPLKAFASSKRRLAEHLTAAERGTLVRELFGGVVDSCLQAPGIDSVLAVVGDDQGAALARAAGASAIADPGGGLNAAVSYATSLVTTEAALVVVADLPLIGAHDVSQLVHASGGEPVVLVAPTHDGGTGGLLRRPADVVAPRYGGPSAAAHLDAARAAGVRAGLIAIPGMAHDVDRPDDFDRYARTSRRTAGAPMPQGTIKDYDPTTGRGTVVLDDREELAFGTEAFLASGLEELRLGQRVRLERSDDTVTRLQVVSL